LFRSKIRLLRNKKGYIMKKTLNVPVRGWWDWLGGGPGGGGTNSSTPRG
jgi:hypothetical protein